MSAPLHLAIIMDGNGRWATARCMPRIAGHRAGAATVRRVIEAAPSLGIETLTLYAFSSDNWKRPPAEVSGLFSLLADFLQRETIDLVRQGVRFTAIGRRDRLDPSLVSLVESTEAATQSGSALHLRVAIDYSSRDALLAAVRNGAESREEVSLMLGGVPDVDLLVRTGGEKRLSDFLLWESAYAELFFTATAWPEFTIAELKTILSDFRSRDRRYGAAPTIPAFAMR
jgi:undecaprenyl diphosphate synthase